MPVLIVEDQRPITNIKRNDIQIGAVDVITSITKFSCQILDARRITAGMREVVRLAE